MRLSLDPANVTKQMSSPPTSRSTHNVSLRRARFPSTDGTAPAAQRARTMSGVA
ncbi:hypothetical protein [Nonomuraea typhae]|uniref:hypothetical protein n=1 Tax=Nonomuraea typhae TaxID=2603600 RepID=UPI0012F845F5|nr:hypothetical protein [Nonomuraea typhae]